MRLFVALNLPDDIKDKIAPLRDESLVGARWTKREQWHITLHFIGEVEAANIITEALKTIQSEAFALKLKGIGTFPEKGKPSVLWAGVEASSALQNLHQKVGNALKTTGFTPEKRPYHPHLTLARFKQSKPSQKELKKYSDFNGNYEIDSFNISEFTLYQSELAPSGAVYTILERFPLGN